MSSSGSGGLGPRLVLVTRESEYEQLLARHATRGQAQAFLRRRSQSLEGLDAQRDRVAAILTEIRAGLPKGWRVANVRRAELDRFLFGPEDVVVAVGQDGLVANVAKYLRGQPVIGVNADPARNAGVLVPHAPGAVPGLLPLAAAGRLPVEERTMIRAELDDGQVLLALNEVFIGHSSHQSARYTIAHGGAEEAQSSSGVIVASGTGATGWALSIGRATGVAVAVGPEERAAVFLVREPWPSKATGVGVVSGRLGTEDRLVLVSRMNEGGVVFADGMEGDRLEFGWGRTLTVTVAAERLRFVPGQGSGARGEALQAGAPVRRSGKRPARTNGAGDGVAPEPVKPRRVEPVAVAPVVVRGGSVPVTGRRYPTLSRRARLRLVVVVAAIVGLVHACSVLLDPEAPRPPDAGAVRTGGGGG